MHDSLRIFKAEFFKALSHPARIKILELLRDGEMSVTALQESLGIEASTVSQHLHLLHQLGLVQCKKRSVWREYSLTPTVARFLRQIQSLAATLTPQE